MGHTIHHETHLLERISNMSENKVLNTWFAIKYVFATIAFVGVVTIWDTLPSLPAIHGVEVKSVITGNHIDIKYTYDVIRAGAFKAEYELRNTKNNIVIVSTDTLVIGSQSPTSHNKMFKVEPDSWCVTSNLSWEKGLSLRHHRQELPKTCFEVAPVQ